MKKNINLFGVMIQKHFSTSRIVNKKRFDERKTTYTQIPPSSSSGGAGPSPLIYSVMFVGFVPKNQPLFLIFIIFDIYYHDKYL